MSYSTTLINCTKDVWTRILTRGNFIKITPTETAFEYYITAQGNDAPTNLDSGIEFISEESFEFVSDLSTDGTQRELVQMFIKPKGRDIDLILTKK